MRCENWRLGKVNGILKCRLTIFNVYEVRQFRLNCKFGVRLRINSFKNLVFIAQIIIIPATVTWILSKLVFHDLIFFSIEVVVIKSS
jgi:hypothetical protein